MLQKFIHVTPQYNFRIILQPGPELCRVDQHLLGPLRRDNPHLDLCPDVPQAPYQKPPPAPVQGGDGRVEAGKGGLQARPGRRGVEQRMCNRSGEQASGVDASVPGIHASGRRRWTTPFPGAGGGSGQGLGVQEDLAPSVPAVAVGAKLPLEPPPEGGEGHGQTSSDEDASVDHGWNESPSVHD